jgi:hypothetical protein
VSNVILHLKGKAKIRDENTWRGRGKIGKNTKGKVEDG